MLPYQELCLALGRWRYKQGLPHSLPPLQAALHGHFIAPAMPAVAPAREEATRIVRQPQAPAEAPGEEVVEADDFVEEEVTAAPDGTREIAVDDVMADMIVDEDGA